MRDYKPFSASLSRNASNLAGMIAALPDDKRIKFESGMLNISRAGENPIEVLSRYADKELAEGRTINLRDLDNDGE